MYGECEGFPSEIFYNIALFGLAIRLVEEIRPFTSWCRWFIPHQQYDDPCRWNGLQSGCWSSGNGEVRLEGLGQVLQLQAADPSTSRIPELSRTAIVVPDLPVLRWFCAKCPQPTSFRFFSRVVLWFPPAFHLESQIHKPPAIWMKTSRGCAWCGFWDFFQDWIGASCSWQGIHRAAMFLFHYCILCKGQSYLK